MGATIFRGNNLYKSFPGVQALRGMSLEVSTQETVAIIGPNGAGKSTLFGVLSGELKSDRGHIYFKEQEITGLAPWRIVRKGLSRCFQIPRIFPRLTVAENILISILANRRITGRFEELGVFLKPLHLFSKQISEILGEVGLSDLIDQSGHFLSHGDKKRLELAMALVINPVLLMLDEPTAGMSPTETEATVKLIQTVSRNRGLTVLLTEHDMSVVFTLADRIAVMNRGELIAEGSPEEISQHPQVIEVYLGTNNEDSSASK